MRKVILGISAVGVMMSIAYGVGARNYPFGSWSAPGPGMYPLCVAVLIFVTSVAMAFESRYGEVDETIEWPLGAPLWRVLAIFGSMILYVLALTFWGHIVASVCLTFAVVQVIGGLQWRLKIFLILGITVGSHFLFVVLLNVPLPTGRWFE